jgi:Spy/CpxP family protein refolding chaperone
MPVDRETLLQRLAKAEDQVELGARNVTRQREIVAQLERDGFDTVGARALLIEFEEAQTAYIAERDRLRREVESLSGVQRG